MRPTYRFGVVSCGWMLQRLDSDHARRCIREARVWRPDRIIVVRLHPAWLIAASGAGVMRTSNKQRGNRPEPQQLLPSLAKHDPQRLRVFIIAKRELIRPSTNALPDRTMRTREALDRSSIAREREPMQLSRKAVGALYSCHESRDGPAWRTLGQPHRANTATHRGGD